MILPAACPSTGAAPAEPKADFGAWWLAGLLALYYALSVIDRMILSHVVEYIKADLSVSDIGISFVLGPAYAVPVAIFGYIFGWMADRYQRRLMLFLGVVAWSLATMMTLFAASLTALVVCRIAVAISEAVLVPVAVSLIADRFPARRLASGMALYSIGPKIGSSLAFVVAGTTIALGHLISGSAVPLLGNRTTWQIVLFLVGAPGLLLALLCWTFREPSRRNLIAVATDYAPASESFLRFLSDRRRLFIPLFLGFCAVGIAGAAAEAWVPAYMNRAYGWNAVQYGPWLGLVSALGSISALLKGAVVDWLFRRGIHDATVRFYSWLLLICLPISVFAFFAPTPYLFFFAYFFAYSVALPFMLYALTSIQLFTPARFRGQMTGLFMMVMPVITYGVGPVSTAVLTDYLFRDPNKLGWSLAIMLGGGMLTGLTFLRLAMRYEEMPARGRDLERI